MVCKIVCASFQFYISISICATNFCSAFWFFLRMVCKMVCAPFQFHFNFTFVQWILVLHFKFFCASFRCKMICVPFQFPFVHRFIAKWFVLYFNSTFQFPFVQRILVLHFEFYLCTKISFCILNFICALFRCKMVCVSFRFPFVQQISNHRFDLLIEDQHFCFAFKFHLWNKFWFCILVSFWISFVHRSATFDRLVQPCWTCSRNFVAK